MLSGFLVERGGAATCLVRVDAVVVIAVGAVPSTSVGQAKENASALASAAVDHLSDLTAPSPVAGRAQITLVNVVDAFGGRRPGCGDRAIGGRTRRGDDRRPGVGGRRRAALCVHLREPDDARGGDADFDLAALRLVNAEGTEVGFPRRLVVGNSVFAILIGGSDDSPPMSSARSSCCRSP